MSTWGTTTSASTYYYSQSSAPRYTKPIKAKVIVISQEEKMARILDEMVAGDEKILFNPEDLVL